MLSVTLLAALATLAVEYFIRTLFISRAKALIACANKAIRIVLASAISDHWKEIVLLYYAKKLAIDTFFIVLMLIGGVSLVVLPALFLDWLFAPIPSTFESLSSVSGLSSMSIAAILYVALRKCLGGI